MSPAKPKAKNPDKPKAGKPAPGADARDEAVLQSAAMPSPFPPIADYAFLSDCHTGLLMAPDGSVNWLCVPAL